MIQSKYDWQFRESVMDESFLKIAKKEGLNQTVAKLVYDRGIQTKDELDHFLKPELDDLHDPYLLHDMERAVQRIRTAIEEGERILVYGDYDADGMTSASILKEALEEIGAECLVYLPNRFTDGYGPNQSVYKYYIEQEQVSLIITVDNGVAGHEAIAYATSQGIDVIVTDHHSLPEILPEAYAIIHPEHPEADYPFKHLAGCGVAFKLACALLDEVQLEFLDLVAIGTIADMVSLTGENRILVKYGLSILRQTGRVGLEELLQIAGVERDQLDEEVVGYQLAPRLNALGRLDDPNPAIDLLTGFDDDEARQLALMIDEKNTERKQIVQDIYQEAKNLVKPDLPVQVLAKEGWNPGVLGIVAGRLLEELYQPVIVLTIEGNRAKGSARSIDAINIFDALAHHKDLFIAFGGHAGAAGMTLEVEKLVDLSQILVRYVKEQDFSQTKNSLLLDEELNLEELTLDTLKSLQHLKPYGMDSAKPIFYVKDFVVESARSMGQGNQHLKFRITKGKASFDVLAFGMGDYANELLQAKPLELAVSLSVNTWNGQTSLQLLLEDFRVRGVQLYDLRGKKAPLPKDVPIVHIEHSLPELSQTREIVLGKIPDKKELVQDFFRKYDFDAVYFKNELATPYYLTGYGSRDQFARLYKTLYRFKEFDVRYKLNDLSQFLKIEQILLIKMLRIFEELGFVTIKDGVMTVIEKAPKRKIDESQIYQELKEIVLYQEVMALGAVQDIYLFLKEDKS